MIGEGIDGLLGVAVRLFVEPGVSAVMPDGAYPTFGFHVTNLGGTWSRCPMWMTRKALMICWPRTRTDAPIVYFTNPDNPMGTLWEQRDVERMINDLPDGVALFFDEAYCEFAS